MRTKNKKKEPPFSDANFLPITRAEMDRRGWDECDFIIVTGDAYVDHPSFGIAIIGRLLEDEGFRVGIIAQPKWQNADDFTHLGRPKYAFMVSGGNLDSMVNNYTVNQKYRNDDSFSPGGKGGNRPDRATLVYCSRIREAFRNIPIILGGIEASLRRCTHYDFWSNKLRRSILIDSKATMLMFGMGETQIIALAKAIRNGDSVEDIHTIPGTSFIASQLPPGIPNKDFVILPSFEEMSNKPRIFAESFMVQYRNTDPINGKMLVEPYGNRFLIQNKAAPALDSALLDRVATLPYARTYHHSYEPQGGVPAIEEVRFSLASSRGCFGGCNFCSLAFHQGRRVQARSHDSLIEEAKKLCSLSGFKGYIHDVGGPTANFRIPSCKAQLKRGVCPQKQCLFPVPCKNLEVDHRDYADLLRKLRNIPTVKKVFIRSGIRFDYLLLDSNKLFFKDMVEHHISGRLKIAPEHIDDTVLNAMGKPSCAVYEKFVKSYNQINTKLGKKQLIVPYFISGHPGADLAAGIRLAQYQQEHNIHSDQVQDFYPTPGTLSTVMYYTGIDPRTMTPIYVAKTVEEKQMQRALLHYRNPLNFSTVRAALRKAHREDLIGFDKHSLVPPEKGKATEKTSYQIWTAQKNSKTRIAEKTPYQERTTQKKNKSKTAEKTRNQSTQKKTHTGKKKKRS